MGQRGFLWLMAAALALMTAAFYFVSERGLPRDPAGTPLLPALAARVDEVTAVLIRKGGPEPVVTLRKVGDAWIVAGSGDPPADRAKLIHLLRALADARLVDEKTTSPADYRYVGVEDPTAPGATGTEIEVDTAYSRYAVIVGRRIGGETIVRRRGERASYGVLPPIAVTADPADWRDARAVPSPPGEPAS